MELTCVESDENLIEIEKHGVIDDEVVDCDKMKEPCVGMTFDSFEEAKDFYEEYGRQKGYNIRTRSTYKDRRGPEVTSALFVCSCEGFNQKIPKSDDEGKIKRSGSTLRSGCKACMRITNVKGTTIWRITVFSDKHNHKLFIPRKKDLTKCNRRRPQITNNLTEGMRVSHICRRLTQLAYMAGRSEAIYKVIMADMDETFKKVSLMDRELIKYKNDEESPNEAISPGGDPAEAIGLQNQEVILDPCTLQANGRKSTEKGKEKICNTQKPVQFATFEGYCSDSLNFAQKKRKPDDSKPGKQTSLSTPPFQAIMSS
ncbi:FAR1 DNA binding domain [Macleaya cordata]|uniref:FAR1 DNA binding domain n=1 Tax=Macleaya cordata TaxID=56857 RepID=A0A200PVA9_MACCD|nr:FAR1 DNA binding domain [Macleaya cordata]